MFGRGGEKRVCLIGSTGAGKSTFLAGLELLGGPDCPSRYALYLPDGDKRLVGAADALRRGEWLPRTEGRHAVRGKLLGEDAGVQLETFDYDGEDARDPTADAALKQALGRADVVLLMLGAGDTGGAELGRVGGGRPDPSEQRDAILKAIRTSRQERKRGPKPVVAVVVTKADMAPELFAPGAARAYLDTLPEFTNKLAREAPGFRAFAVSAVGGVVDDRPQVPPRPRGYDELLGWVFEQARQNSKVYRRAAAGILALALLAAGLLIWGGRETDDAIKRVRDLAALDRHKNDPAELAGVARSSDDAAVQEQAVRQVREWLGELNKRAEAGLSENEARTALGQVREARQRGLPAVADDLDQAEKGLTAKLRTDGLSRLLARYRPGLLDEPLRADLERFSSEWSGTPEAEKAKATVRDMSEAVRLRERADVVAQHVPGRAEFERKVRLATDYLAKYRQHEPNAGSIDRAIRVAGRLLGRDSYRVTLTGSGRFDANRWHLVNVRPGGDSLWFENRGPRAKTAEWSETFEVNWTAGDEIGVDLVVRYSYGLSTADKPAATRRLGGPLALLELSGEVLLDPVAGWGFERRPFVTLRLAGLDAEDVRCVRDYLRYSDGW